MRLQSARRVTSDNVAPEQREVVDSIGVSVNPFIEDVTEILNGRVGFDNLESKVAKISISTDLNGKLVGNSDILTGLPRPPIGALVVDIRNTNNFDLPVDITSAPFVLYRPISNTTIRVDNILNLKPNQKYTISILFL